MPELHVIVNQHPSIKEFKIIRGLKELAFLTQLISCSSASQRILMGSRDKGW
jgi:hypothetical protein